MLSAVWTLELRDERKTVFCSRFLEFCLFFVPARTQHPVRYTAVRFDVVCYKRFGWDWPSVRPDTRTLCICVAFKSPVENLTSLKYMYCILWITLTPIFMSRYKTDGQTDGRTDRQDAQCGLQDSCVIILLILLGMLPAFTTLYTVIFGDIIGAINLALFQMDNSYLRNILFVCHLL